ncbi:MAG: hypothetical protein B7Z42_07015 [Brevundimonas sp. 12-68-7]|nr:MAG: hypothetical protein B7Z42_07015 [Brevundimonas sp. 12-68-7]
MGLEHWDPERGKWLLYQSGPEHTEDCARHPFEAIPRRVFLDTNVLNLLVKHSEQVFEQVPISSTFDKTRAHDIEALMHVFQVGAPGIHLTKTSERNCWTTPCSLLRSPVRTAPMPRISVDS